MMKTNYLKVVTPLIAIILAVSGSYTAHTSERKGMAKVACYLSPIGGTRCSLSFICSNIVNPVVCTATYQGVTYQLFRKASPNDTVCDIVCYRNID